MAPFDPAKVKATPLLASEIADAEELVREAGWNQTAADWRAFLELGTVYAIRADDGRVIATAATLPYGGQFAWISMVLVARDYQRRGLATRLLRECIDDITAAKLVPVLDATPAGREVYRNLGFLDAWGFRRLACTAIQEASKTTVSPHIEIRNVTEDIWPALCAYDAGVFGAERSKLLATLRGRTPHIERVALRNGKIAGFVLGRDGRLATQVGPLVADNDDVARALLAHALDEIHGPAFIDVPDTKTDLLAYLAARGFAPQRPLTRMLLGRNTAYDDGTRTYAVVGPEFG
ncbi:MAG: GNAT family N-acetyltransferase [Xanthobacteraceae bacterium]